jgi:hypothetical protein
MKTSNDMATFFLERTAGAIMSFLDTIKEGFDQSGRAEPEWLMSLRNSLHERQLGIREESDKFEKAMFAVMGDREEKRAKDRAKMRAEWDEKIAKNQLEIDKLFGEARAKLFFKAVWPAIMQILFGQNAAAGGGGLTNWADAVKGTFQSPNFAAQLAYGDKADGKRLLIANQETANNTKKLVEQGEKKQPGLLLL